MSSNDWPTVNEREAPPAANVAHYDRAQPRRRFPVTELPPAEEYSKLAAEKLREKERKRRKRRKARAAAAAAAAAERLPRGWAAEADPGSGETYYQNATTGETSWERPQIDEHDDDNGHAASAGSSTTPHRRNATPSAAGGAASSSASSSSSSRPGFGFGFGGFGRGAPAHTRTPTTARNGSFNKRDRVKYRSPSGAWLNATVVEKSYDDPPYYTIRPDNGQERQTEGERERTTTPEQKKPFQFFSKMTQLTRERERERERPGRRHRPQAAAAGRHRHSSGNRHEIPHTTRATRANRTDNGERCTVERWSVRWSVRERGE